MVEYWLASRLGHLWLTLHKSLQSPLGDLPDECARIAHGQMLSAARLCRVQAFAARVWWRTAMAGLLFLFPVIGVGAVLRPGRIGTDIGVALMAVALCVAAVALAQMGVASFRSAQIRQYLLKSGPDAADQPLPRGSLGLPSRWDFWVTLLLALAVFGVLLYAGTRAAHGG
jgi:hypothetical protein